ncbi:MAG: AMP-binding protein, partial [Phormidesmis sp.]
MVAALHEQEKINWSKAIDYSNVSAIPEVWPIVAAKYGDHIALHDPHTNPATQYTYRELASAINQFAAGLQALGLQPQEKIALFSENRPRWMVADQGIMTAGAIDAVRGANADRAELLFILENSDSIGLVVQDISVLSKLADGLSDRSLRFIILLTDEAAEIDADLGGAKLLNFSELMNLGTGLTPVVFDRSFTATLMYTSGTSGMPKGVMLSQSNL